MWRYVVVLDSVFFLQVIVAQPDEHVVEACILGRAIVLGRSDVETLQVDGVAVFVVQMQIDVESRFRLVDEGGWFE